MAFVRNMFIRPDATALPTFEPNFTVLHAPEFEADPRSTARAPARRSC
jgi:phosphoenolpyruvate carboxykinase (ATP)